jgi:hypothetical protein
MRQLPKTSRDAQRILTISKENQRHLE